VYTDIGKIYATNKLGTE